jgi:S-adenosylmethionine synthetase
VDEMADYLELQVAYTIGKARPLSLSIETFSTGKVPDEIILNLINKHFDFRPEAIIRTLDLRRPFTAKLLLTGTLAGKTSTFPGRERIRPKS